MPKYDILLLDADGTLFDFHRAEREALQKMLTDRGIACDEQVLETYRTINNSLWRQLEDGTITREELLSSRFARLFEALHLDCSSEGCNDAYLDALSQGSYLLPQAEEVCRTLAGHCKLCLATNGVNAVQRRRLQDSPIRQYISEIFVSEELGAQKPDPRFYDVLFERLGVQDRSRAIMLGDSLNSDMRGALAAGIASCWLNPSGAESGGLKVDYEIRQLQEFIPIVMGEGSAE